MVNKETDVLSYENKHHFPQNTKQIQKGGIDSKNELNKLNELNGLNELYGLNELNTNVSQTLGKTSGKPKLKQNVIKLLGYGFYEANSSKDQMRMN
jgi:hypothetical protein